jgi:hypothetical protein
MDISIVCKRKSTVKRDDPVGNDSPLPLSAEVSKYRFVSGYLHLAAAMETPAPSYY